MVYIYVGWSYCLRWIGCLSYPGCQFEFGSFSNPMYTCINGFSFQSQIHVFGCPSILSTYIHVSGLSFQTHIHVFGLSFQSHIHVFGCLCSILLAASYPANHRWVSHKVFGTGPSLSACGDKTYFTKHASSSVPPSSPSVDPGNALGVGASSSVRVVCKKAARCNASHRSLCRHCCTSFSKQPAPMHSKCTFIKWGVCQN